MNTLAHIVRKDLRRLALPLALWLALVAGKAAALVAYAGGGLPWPGEWLGPAVFCANGLEAAFGFLLAAWLTLEDSPIDPRAFWTTRPISGGHLLAAKLCGAGLAFVVAPLSLLTPVWLAAGFGPDECMLAALDWTLSQGCVTLVALAAAAVSHGFHQVILAPAVLAPLAALGVAADWRTPGGWAGGFALAGLASVLALALQFTARRRWSALIVLGLGCGVAAGGLGWVRAPRAQVDERAFTLGEAGSPIEIGAMQEAAGGRCHLTDVRKGWVKLHAEDGFTREERVATRIWVREAGFESGLFGGVEAPGVVFRWRTDGGETEQAQAGRRGRVGAASIRVTDRDVELPAGTEKIASWHVWRAVETPSVNE